jgi:hypothetical protein
MKHRSSRVALCAALLSVAALTAGCAAASSSGAGSGTGNASGTGTAASGSAGAASAGTPAPVPTISATGPAPVGGVAACADWPASVPAGPLPATFVPVSVLRCVTGYKQIPGKGLYFAATTERYDGNLSALATALRAPSGTRKPGTMCPMIAMVPPQIVLIAKDGSMLSPKLPLSGCGLLQTAVLRELNLLPWHAVSVRVFSPVPGSTGPGTPATSDPQPTDLIPGPAKSGVNNPGPGGPAR